jgi:hypothetical protein
MKAKRKVGMGYKRKYNSEMLLAKKKKNGK